MDDPCCLSKACFSLLLLPFHLSLGFHLPSLLPHPLVWTLPLNTCSQFCSLPPNFDVLQHTYRLKTLQSNFPGNYLATTLQSTYSKPKGRLFPSLFWASYFYQWHIILPVIHSLLSPISNWSDLPPIIPGCPILHQDYLLGYLSLHNNQFQI